MKVIILAGGKGTRLWPLSNNILPKQFLKFKSNRSLLQMTIIRFLKSVDAKDLFILTEEKYRDAAKEQAGEIYRTLENQIIIEPVAKGTAAAVGYAMQVLKKKEEVIVISCSDHFISDETCFAKGLEVAEKHALKGEIVTFGIQPIRAETGYGYLETGKRKEGVFEGKCFVEKPAKSQAEAMLRSGRFLWNMGIFAFTPENFEVICKEHCPQLLGDVESMPKLSFDHAVMEKLERFSIVPLDLKWLDIGSWDNVYHYLNKNERGNVKIGQVFEQDTNDCLILSQSKPIYTIGVSDLLVVETDEAILIVKKGESQKVREVALGSQN